MTRPRTTVHIGQAAAQLTRRWSTAIGVSLLALIAYVPVLLSSPGRMPADTKLFLYLDPGGLTADAPWSFDPGQYAGWVPHQHITYLWPAGPWFWLFETIGVPDWVAHRLWVGTILFTAGLGARWLARTLGIGVPGALVAAVVYQLSPYVVPYVSRTSLMLLPWAGLGWIVALTARAAVRSRWRDAALLALVIATVGSPNATALAMIAPAPLLWLVHAAWSRDITWFRATVTAAKIGVLTIGASLWWIAMLAVQGRYGADVLAYSESLEAVSSTSSANEVLRGLGYWVNYVRDANLRPATSAADDYMTSTLVIASGFMLVVLGLFGLAATRWAHRRYALLVFAAGLVLGVGVHPLGDPAPITTLLVDDTESGIALALRSSTRAIPMIGLALALGVGALTTAMRPRRHWARAMVPAVILLLAVVNMPSLWLRNYVDPVIDRDQDPPRAWTDAAGDLDALPDGFRVLQVPGQEFGAYRWGYTVDQPLPGLTDRPVVTRDVLPLGSAQAMDLLFAFDDRFQEGLVEPASIAPISRLFGADTIWVANDTAFERLNTPRPEITTRTFDERPAGLGEPTRYGKPTAVRSRPDISDDEAVTDHSVGDKVAPVLLVPIEDAVPVVRAKSQEVIVSGSGDGIVDAAAAGLIDGTELIRYSADLADGAELGSAAALIVTDSNRDRAHRWNSAQNVVGFTETGGPSIGVLRAETADGRLPIFDSTDPEFQTTAQQVGPVTAVASAYGDVDGYRPEDRAAMAIDGDTTTSWRVGEHAPVAGEKIRLQVNQVVDHVTLLQGPHADRQRHITQIKLEVSGYGPRRILLDETSLREGQRIPIGPTDGPVTVTISVVATESPFDVAGPAQAAVGFAEIDFGVGHTTEVVRPPSDLLARLDEVPEGVPLTVLFTRLRADPHDRSRSDPERALIRGFDVPTDVDVTPAITARVDANVTDDVLERLLGIEIPIASGRVTGSPRSAGWATADGDPGTAWITPFAFIHGESLKVQVPEGETLTEFEMTQPNGRYSRISKLRVAMGRKVWTVAVPRPDADGTSAIELPAPVSGQIELTITGIDGTVVFDNRSGAPVYLPAAISEISIGPRVELPETVDLGCRDDLLTIDGTPVSLRLAGTVDEVLDGDPLDVTRCSGSAPITLTAGEHLLASTSTTGTGIGIDRVLLQSDAPGADATSRSESPIAKVVSSNRTTTKVSVGPCPQGCWLVHGVGYSTAWEATAAGTDLGEPKPVDGGFNGWWIAPTEDAVHVTITWTAQGSVTKGIVVSLLVVLLAIVLVVFDRRRRGDPGRPVGAGISTAGVTVSPRRAAIASAAGVLAAVWFITPVAGLWIAGVGAAVVITRRPRIAAWAAVATALYVGAATVYTVWNERPPANGSWLLHVEHLHRVALAVAILALIAAIGTTDRNEQRRGPGHLLG